MAILAGALQQVIQLCMQVDHGAALMQVLAVFFLQHRPATGGQDDIVSLSELVDGCCFTLAKACFTLDLKNHGNTHPGMGLDLMVAIEKGEFELFGQVPANGGFAGPHGADKEDVCFVQYSGYSMDGYGATISIGISTVPSAI